jgi:hypothetical protein
LQKAIDAVGVNPNHNALGILRDDFIWTSPFDALQLGENKLWGIPQSQSPKDAPKSPLLCFWKDMVAMAVHQGASSIGLPSTEQSQMWRSRQEYS